VALCAGLGKARRLVIRIRRTRIIGPVAIDAVGAETGVLVVHMTAVAGDRSMGTCQRKPCIRVIECRRRPGCG
jgi:hypothetical protein